MTDDQKELKARLMSRHPWYLEQSTKERWGLLRAVQSEVSSTAEKRAYLPRADLEKEEHYDKRVQMTEFAGMALQMASRFTAAVFGDGLSVEIPDENPMVRAWHDDTDGDGTRLVEWLEDQAEEAALMGRVGVMLNLTSDKPLDASMPRSQDDDERDNVRLRITAWGTEEITDWEVDDKTGKPLWVKMERIQTERETFDATPKRYHVWWILTPDSVTTYRAELKEDANQEREITPSGKPFEEGGDIASSPANGLGYTDLGRIEGPDSKPHPYQRIPMDFIYGVRRKGQPWGQGRSLLFGSARQDIAGMREDSSGTWSRYLHNNPAAVIWTDEDVDTVVTNKGIKLRPGGPQNEREDFQYRNTDSGAHGISMTALEMRRIESIRQAGADSSVWGDSGGADQESGRARQMRFTSGESRVLRKMASSVARTHRVILEMAAKAYQEPDFAGTVQYPTHFELEDTGTLLEQYSTARLEGFAEMSPTWDQNMRQRIAVGMMGDSPQSVVEKVREEFKAAAKASSTEPAADTDGDDPPPPEPIAPEGADQ